MIGDIEPIRDWVRWATAYPLSAMHHSEIERLASLVKAADETALQRSHVENLERLALSNGELAAERLRRIAELEEKVKALERQLSDWESIGDQLRD